MVSGNGSQQQQQLVSNNKENIDKAGGQVQLAAPTSISKQNGVADRAAVKQPPIVEAVLSQAALNRARFSLKSYTITVSILARAIF